VANIVKCVLCEWIKTKSRNSGKQKRQWRSGERKEMGKINGKMWKEIGVWNFCIIFGN